MKTRDVVIFSGKRFKVPQCIQRIDHRYTHGWQVRYGGTKMFSDGSNDGSGAKASLEAATRELISRIATMPAPSKLQPRPSASKSTDLPVGISGPLLRQRAGSKVRYASLQVLLPCFGEKPRNRNIYIGSEATYTPERYKEALAKAIEMRQAAEEAYRADELRARRAGAKEMKSLLNEARKTASDKVTARAAAKAAPKTAAKPAPKAPTKAPVKAPAKAASKKSRVATKDADAA